MFRKRWNASTRKTVSMQQQMNKHASQCFAACRINTPSYKIQVALNMHTLDESDTKQTCSHNFQNTNTTSMRIRFRESKLAMLDTLTEAIQMRCHTISFLWIFMGNSHFLDEIAIDEFLILYSWSMAYNIKKRFLARR